MGTIIYFVENEKRKCAIRFVKSYRAKSWWRMERIEYTYSLAEGNNFVDSAVTDKVCERIREDFPDAVIYRINPSEFHRQYETHRFWLICSFTKKTDTDGYFSHIMSKKVMWTNNINDAEILLDEKNAEDSANSIRRLCGTTTMVGIQTIYLNLENMLLTPIMMITCTSKYGKQETKYFARLDGNRLRLVNTSDAAKKFTYTEVMDMFEHLRTHNKNFLYAVLPAFKENVHYKNLEAYVTENNVSRMVQISLMLKWENR